MSSAELKSVPVFVYPTLLNFYTNDANSYKQILTLFNPYDFPIKFKVLCNQPKKYAVAEPEGVIKPKCCVDLVIRHVDVNYLNENLTDKLRLQIYKLDDVKNPIGKKDVPLTLISNKFSTDAGSLNTSFTNHGNSLSSTMGYNNQQHIGSNLNIGHPNRSLFQLTNNAYYFMQTDSYMTNFKNSRKKNDHIENVNYLVILVGITCLGLLFLPTIGDTQSSLPKYLHLSFEMKLLASYILGMVTLAILRY